jgi:hypothetical protein
MKKVNGNGKRVLVIPDTHIPYAHPDYMKFLKYLKSKYTPDLAIHLGDELDYHAISFHDSDSSLFSADRELDNAIIELQEGLHKEFPRLLVLESNHGSLVYRKMKANGLPIRVLKSMQELYGTKLWSWHHEILLSTKLGPVYFCHGKSSAYGKLAKEMGCSAIQGHFHSKFEITWHNSATGSRFNAFAGCLVDERSMAMAYARNSLPKPIHGAILIDERGLPRLLKMKLNARGRWDGFTF